MSRSARLLALVQELRRHRRPVTAARLAQELGVSLRTMYRDIATLVAQGAPIEGEAGFGYVLKPGFFLPPLMFSDDEVDALLLGLQLVQQRGDIDLQEAADHAAAKIAALLPPALEEKAMASGLLAGPHSAGAPDHVALIRSAMRRENKLRLTYRDKRETTTERTVWPVALGFFQDSEVLAAWCELRDDFRHFRLDRIVAAEPMEVRMPRRRRLLLAEWRSAEDLDL